ncbi:MAG TPA: glycosyltransferase [Actinospica sp.]|nr:glycosyltransferase [Actinospica sp.]
MKILLCPLSDGGYLYPVIAAGRELRRRGHRVELLGRGAAAPVAAEAGLPFTAAEELGGRRAFSAIWWGLTGLDQYRTVLRAAREAKPDLLVTSALCTGALLAAEALDLPIVVIGLSVHLYDYGSGGDGEPYLGRTRTSRTEQSELIYAGVREQAGLASRAARWRHSPLLGDATLLRGVPELEHPGALLPDPVRHVGPLEWEPAADPAELAAVRDRLAERGKPVVYVHLGRNFGGRSLWPRLNEAFAGGRFQAIVEQGRSTEPRPDPAADVVLVRKPWMGPLVDLAGLVLTSGTSAPVLAALRRGLPLAVSPNGSEQPLLSVACIRAGVAVHVPNTAATDTAGLLDTAWHDGALRERARGLGHRLAATDGTARAADAIEAAARASTIPREDHELAISQP